MIPILRYEHYPTAGFDAFTGNVIPNKQGPPLIVILFSDPIVIESYSFGSLSVDHPRRSQAPSSWLLMGGNSMTQDYNITLDGHSNVIWNQPYRQFYPSNKKVVTQIVLFFTRSTQDPQTYRWGKKIWISNLMINGQLIVLVPSSLTTDLSVPSHSKPPTLRHFLILLLGCLILMILLFLFLQAKDKKHQQHRRIIVK